VGTSPAKSLLKVPGLMFCSPPLAMSTQSRAENIAHTSYTILGFHTTSEVVDIRFKDDMVLDLDSGSTGRERWHICLSHANLPRPRWRLRTAGGQGAIIFSNFDT
jgi:hypothetical protein